LRYRLLSETIGPSPLDCVSSLGQERRLVFVKSIMVGIATMVSAAICSGIAVMIVLAFKSRNLPDGQTFNWDPFVRLS
jgi:hypothetical protein